MEARKLFISSLLQQLCAGEGFSVCIKVSVFIDPPFNTGQAFENYDDNLEMSIWLDLMRSRLQIIHTLLKDDGTLFVHIDDQNLPYLTLLLDEIFGKQNRLYLITFKPAALLQQILY